MARVARQTGARSMTYAEWYLTEMEDRLKEGGKQDVVDKTIAQVNNPTNEGLTQYLQTKTAAVLLCGVCGASYRPDEVTPSLEKEMLCPNCVKSNSPS